MITQKGTASAAVGRKDKRAPGRVMPFRRGLLIPVFATLAVTGAGGRGSGAPPASLGQAPRPRRGRTSS